MKRFTWYPGVVLCAMLAVWLPTGAYAQITTTDYAAGVGPLAVAVNPVTNKAYVANYNYVRAEVTVIDMNKISNITSTVIAGFSPAAVVVNPVTNKIYVANFDGNSVTVINGATDTFLTNVIDTNGKGPAAIAVNPETNRVYIGNYKSWNVTVIDGATNEVIKTVSLLNTAVIGVTPLMCMAVNPVTNKVYVTNYHDNSVTVIDGSNVPNKIFVGTNPQAVAVNPKTNKIYVVNKTSSNVTVIDGVSDSVIVPPVPVGNSPMAVVINPVTNRIYIVNSNNGSGGSVSVIDGATDLPLPAVTTGSNSQAITVNLVSNKVYVANKSSNDVTVIDAANSNQATSIPAGPSPVAVAVNMITNEVYVANNDAQDPLSNPAFGSVTVITETPAPPSPLPASITPLSGDTTNSATPTFTMSATSSTGSPVSTVYYQVDTKLGAWLAATPAGGGSFNGTTPILTAGAHTLYAFAADGSDATSINTGSQSSPLIGAIASYPFTVSTVVPPVTYTVTPVNTAHGSISPVTQQVVNSGAIVDFTVMPDIGYQIDTVTGSGCSVLLLPNPPPAIYRAGPVTANCTVTPTYRTVLLPVRIGATPYLNLVDAYATASSGDVIDAMATTFIGDLNLNRPGIAVALHGGYDVTYATRTGNSVIVGKLIIGSGSVVVDRLIIQ